MSTKLPSFGLLLNYHANTGFGPVQLTAGLDRMVSRRRYAARPAAGLPHKRRLVAGMRSDYNAPLDAGQDVSLLQICL